MPVIDGTAVVLSPETAYYLEKVCNVSALRQRLRDGRHPVVSQELLDLRRVGMSFDPSSLAQVESDPTQVAPESESGLMSVAEVADLLGLTTQAVTLACREGRLVAEQVGPRRPWQITRDALDDYRAARAA